jgi:hypothetical protein
MNLSQLLSNVTGLMPKLRHLSLLGNLACPHPLIYDYLASSEANYKRCFLITTTYIIKTRCATYYILGTAAVMTSTIVTVLCNAMKNLFEFDRQSRISTVSIATSYHTPKNGTTE